MLSFHHLFCGFIISITLYHVQAWHSILTDHAHLATHISHTVQHLSARTTHVEGGPHVPGLVTDILKPTTSAFSKEFVEESERLIVSDIRSTYETFKQATVPSKVANAIAGIFAEVAAGTSTSLSFYSLFSPHLTHCFPFPTQQVVWED